MWGLSSPGNELTGRFRKEPERYEGFGEQPLSNGTCLPAHFVWHPTNLFNQNHLLFLPQMSFWKVWRREGAPLGTGLVWQTTCLAGSLEQLKLSWRHRIGGAICMSNVQGKGLINNTSLKSLPNVYPKRPEGNSSLEMRAGCANRWNLTVFARRNGTKGWGQKFSNSKDFH